MIRPYRPSDNASAVRCLLSAFHDDPLFRRMGRGYKWETTASRMFSWTIYMLHGSFGMTEVMVSDDGNQQQQQEEEVVCLAGWELAGMTLGAALRGLVFIIVVLFCSGPALVGRYLSVMFKLERRRHALAPTAHHLQILGTDGACQGQGLGSKLIKVGIQRATEAGVACYLESSNPQNIPFYERQGFRVLEEIYLFEDKKPGGEGKGPVCTLMLRQLGEQKKKDR